MLHQNFYTIISTEVNGDEVNAVIHINKKHTIFEGHFPNFPVTPGVAMLQMVKELTQNHLNLKLMLTSASNIKFLSLVNPNAHSHLYFHIQINQDENLVRVKNTTSFEDGTIVLKCNVNFALR